VVLDEADQMLAVGFDEDVEVIMEQLPQNRQSMLFSATMPSWIRKISNKYLKDPVIIDLMSDFFYYLSVIFVLLSLACLVTIVHSFVTIVLDKESLYLKTGGYKKLEWLSEGF
jgi:hypothetical protein